MALSFAVIVASYSAKEDLATGVRIAITAIYFMAAYALLARWITEMVRLDEIHEIMASRGVVFEPVWYAPQTRMATYILGSLLTIGAVFYFGNKTENNVDVDT